MNATNLGIAAAALIGFVLALAILASAVRNAIAQTKNN